MLDLTGNRYGKLLVLKENDEPYISPAGVKTRRWDCVCDCGNRLTVLQNALTAKKNGTRSCGCSRRLVEMDDLPGKTVGRLTVIRPEKLEKPEANGTLHGWLCRCECGNIVILSTKALKSGKVKSCGCLLSERSKDTVADKVGQFSGTTVSAISDSRGANKNSRSGVKGVYWSNREKCWIAKIGFRGKSITIGRFSDIDDARKAREKAEEKYFEPVIKAYKAKRKKN